MNPASRLVLLLPERRRFRGHALPDPLARALGRADRLPPAEPGEKAQLQRHFDILPRGWPMAALMRQREAGDAGRATWLRADPAFVRAELTGARLMAWGNLGLSEAEADELLAPLKPVFGDAGFPISRTRPEHWYLQLPADARLPCFSLPTDALGGQLLAHLPEGDEARRWRQLGTEAQVILHNHPLTARRVAHGLTPVNTLWFWGDGRLPDSVRAPWRGVVDADDELAALAQAASMPMQGAAAGDVLQDARRVRDPAVLDACLRSALDSLPARHAELVLDFADGQAWRLAPGQRWRLLRKSLRGLED
jgi:hypothetical protein